MSLLEGELGAAGAHAYYKGFGDGGRGHFSSRFSVLARGVGFANQKEGHM